jgi:hypothetical protein
MIVWHIIHRSEILYGARKTILLKVKKAKISLQGHKTEFGTQNQYDRVAYPSFGNFIRSKKNYTFKGKKSENKPSDFFLTFRITTCKIPNR